MYWMLLVSRRQLTYLTKLFFTPCQMRTKVSKLVVCGIAFVWFPKAYPLWIKTGKDTRCNSFIHSVVSLTTGPKPLPKLAFHIVQARASTFKWEYPLLSLRSSSSFLRLLPRLLVPYIPPFIFPSITRCRRQFLRKMWPVQFAFRLLILRRIFLCSLTLSNTSSFLTCYQ